ncbi:SN protein, partial [Centropus bengalensis]|nr:SN protein [Centropus bengalensis]
PSIVAAEEQTEGQMSSFVCSVPYVCPQNGVSLRWKGYDPQVSVVSSWDQLDSSSGVSHYLNLTTSFSWKNHSKKLLCEVSYGSRMKIGEVLLRVKHAPKDIQVSLSPSGQNIHQGDTVSFTCVVGSTYPSVSTYHWMKDGAILGSEQNLTLRDVHLEDYGQYHCEARNGLGAGVAPPVMLYIFCKCQGRKPGAGAFLEEEQCHGRGMEFGQNPDWGGQEMEWRWPEPSGGPGAGKSMVEDCDVPIGWPCPTPWDLLSCSIPFPPPDPPRPPTITLFQEAQGGRLAVVLCTVDSHPPATMAIYHDDTLLAINGSQAAPRQHLGVTTSRNALRLEIRGAGPQDSGEYRCVATNQYGNTSSTKVFVARAPEVLIQPSAEVLEGEAVTLTCLGSPGVGEEPLYTWYRNSKQLWEGLDPRMLFPSIRGEDAGAFQCRRCFNPAVPPRQPVMSSFLETQGGHLGIIQCSVESDPEANLTLWKGEEVIACGRGCSTTPRPRFHSTSSQNSLKVEIQEVVVEDEGTYVCRAGNTQGNSSASMDFRA